MLDVNVECCGVPASSLSGPTVIVKPVLTYIPPFGLALMRVGMALPFLFAVAYAVRRRMQDKPL
jgi:hypothetical protein